MWWWGLAGLAALLGAMLVLVNMLDTSRSLSQDESGRLVDFVRDTQSPLVREAYQGATADGVVTIDESREVFEAAKAAPAPYGLISGSE